MMRFDRWAGLWMWLVSLFSPPYIVTKEKQVQGLTMPTWASYTLTKTNETGHDLVVFFLISRPSKGWNTLGHITATRHSKEELLVYRYKDKLCDTSSNKLFHVYWRILRKICLTNRILSLQQVAHIKLSTQIFSPKNSPVQTKHLLLWSVTATCCCSLSPSMF